MTELAPGSQTVLDERTDARLDAGDHERLSHYVAKNKLTEANQQAVLDAYIQRVDADHFVRLVDNSEIGENAYNIAVSSYVEAEDTREVVDITALNAEIARIVARQQELRVQIDAIVADLEEDRQGTSRTSSRTGS